MKTFARLSQTFLFLAPALVFGSWACLLLRLNQAQELTNLQSPRFHLYSLTGAAVLLGISVLFPLLFIPSTSDLRTSLSQFLKKFLSILWLLLPAGAYLLLPPDFTVPAALLDRAWSSAMSRSQGAFSAGRVDPAVVRNFILQSDPHAPLSLSPVDLTIVQAEPELKEVLTKRRVEILGQWLPLEKNPPDEFTLVRLLMTCCVADVRPVGVLTQGKTEGAQSGDWFKATGTLIFDDPRQNIILKADQVEEVEPPEEIFLY